MAFLRLFLAALILSGAAVFAAVAAPISPGIATGPQPRAQVDPSEAAREVLEEQAEDLSRRRGLRPDDPFVAHDLGRVLWHLGRQDQALALWREAAAASPNLPAAELRARVEKVFQAIAQGDRQAARGHLAVIEDRYADDPHYLMIRGEQAFRSGNVQAAEASLRQAVARGSDLFITHLSLARFYEQAGKTAEARRAYARAVSLDETCGQCQSAFGRFLLSVGETEEALARLSRAHALDADAFPLAEAVAGQEAAGRGDLIGARHWYGRAVSIAPAETAGARLALADVLLQLDLVEDARAHVDWVAARNDAPGIRLFQASTAEIAGDFESAEALYRAILKASPDLTVAANNLAMLIVRRGGDASEALRLAQKAVAAGGTDDPDLVGTLACAAAAAGAEKAPALLRRAVLLAPGDPWVRWYLGQALAAAGDANAAALHLEGVLLLDPQFPHRNAVADWLTEHRAPG